MRGWFRRRRNSQRMSRKERTEERRQNAIRQLVGEPLEQRLLLTAVTSMDPLANTHAAVLSTDVSVSFDENIDGATATTATLAVHSQQRGQLVGPAATVGVAGPTVTLSPAMDFFPGELVQVSVTPAIGSVAGVASDPLVWQFRAGTTGGSGEFTDTGQVLAANTSSDVAVGDLDADGDLDAFVTNTNSGNRVWLNEAGGFSDSGQVLGNHNSVAVSLGDVDGDGDLDAFVANAYEGNRIWINDGGTFSDSGQSLGDHGSYDVSLGDFDADGDLDAFVANRLQGNRVWLNDGGVFADSGQSLGAQDSYRVDVGDIDGDGDLDAFVANAYQGNRVWLNAGGVFADSGQSLGNNNSLGIALGDVDGDGDLDAFVANYYQGNRVWLNFGGVFINSGQSLGDHSSYTVELGDLDGDGDLDAFVANSGQGNRVWLNDAGLFTSLQPLGSFESFAVALGDFDGDGDQDAFVANFDQDNRVWLNQSPSFSISPQRLAVAEGDSGVTALSVTVTRQFVANGVATVDYEVIPSGIDPADVDDFVGAAFPSGTLTFADGVTTLALNIEIAADTAVEGDERFTLSLSNPVGNNATIGVGTVDVVIRNDDNVDLGDLPAPFRTTLDSNGAAHIAVGPTLGTGRDTEPDGQPGGALPDGDDVSNTDDEDGIVFGPVSAGHTDGRVTVVASASAKLDAWIDFNGDGSLDGAGEQIFTSQDIVAGSNELTFGVPVDARQGTTFSRFRISSAGGLAPTGGAADGEVEDHEVTIGSPIGRNQFNDSGQLIGDHESAGVAVGDLDGDGDLDAFVANRYAGNRVWVNDGGTFSDTGRTLGNHNSADVALGDLDGDGDLDAFVANSGEGNRIWVNVEGHFTDGGQLLGNSNSYAVALGDFDEDGDLDAFVANASQANRIWLNDGGSFTDSGQSLGSAASQDIAVGDLDGDGDLDGLVANSSGANRVWLNDGGRFSAGPELGDHSSFGVALGDLDGDGDLDALFANDYQGNRVWVNSDGVFTDSGQSLGEQASSAVALGDVDADGDLDAFVTNYEGSNRIWLNAAGTFSADSQTLGDHVSSGVALGDLDGDGDVDAFVANETENRVWHNENPTFSVVPDVLAQAEGNSGMTTMTFTIVRLFDTSGAATVDYAFALGGVDPAELSDFAGSTLSSGTLSFADGEASQEVAIDILGDLEIENDEGFTLTISNPVGQDAVIGNATAQGLILNDDGLDFGDLPAPFATLLADGGPAHVASGPRLGTSLDTEVDGLPSALADGDDLDGVQDDEEGVTFGPLIFAGQVGAEVTVHASAEAKLDAWIDFDGDGQFGSPGEQVFTSRDLVAGDNPLTFIVPADAQQGLTFSRFRLSTEGGLLPTGTAADGEVEDHALVIGNPVGTSFFTDSGQSLVNGNSRDVAVADLNGDGNLDAFIANSSQGNRVALSLVGIFSLTNQQIGTHLSNAVELGDLDGDGDLDAFVANGYLHANRVWLNDGAAVFTDSGQLLGARDSNDVDLGDLDGDGDLDAFVANGGSAGNTVWLNSGGIFSDTGQSLGTHDSRAVMLGDVDGDGDLDAFTANFGQGNRVWINEGGVFSDSAQSLGAYPSSDVALGDIDGDGDLDAFVTNVGTGGRVWRNDEGVFSDSEQSLGSQDTRGVALGDLDGDGDLDAFLANSGQGNQVLWNYEGQFVDSGQSFANHNSYAVALGDVDGDGDLDAFVGNSGQGNRVWMNRSSNFTISPPILGLAEGNSGSTDFVFTISRNIDRGSGRVDYSFAPSGLDPAEAADLTNAVFPSGTLSFGDTVTELPLSIEVAGDTTIENDEGFELTITYSDGFTSVTEVATAFIRNDDGVDLGDAPAPFPTLLSNNGAAHIAIGPTLGAARDTEPDGQPSSLADGDDAAGTDDEDGVTFAPLLFAGQLGAEVTVNASRPGHLDAWIDFNGDGSFDLAHEQVFASQDVVAGDNVFAFDVPADARQGVTFARFRVSSAGGLAPSGGAADGEVEDHLLTITGPLGSGLFRDSAQVLGAQDGRGVAIGDLDGDGDLDAFVANQGANRVWLNTDGVFVDSGQSLGDHSSAAVALGDLDADGDLDAFVANEADQGNRIWVNNNGVFVSSGQSLGVDTSLDIALGDLDADGDLDAVVANGISRGSRVWLNSGGIFNDSGQSLGSRGSLGVALGDLDGDGDLDAFLANGSDGNQVWLNEGGRLTDSGLDLGNHSSFAVALGDLDQDGDLDAFVANRSQADRIWLNDGGQFTDSGQTLGNHEGAAVALGDLDGDGDLDAYVANNYQSNRIWLNNAGTFQDSGQYLGGRRSLGAALGDLDRDGDLDAFVANYGSGNRVWLNENPTLNVLPAVLPMAEGNGGTTTFTFAVTRAFDTRGTVSVDYAFALAGSNPAQLDDFVAGTLPSGTLTFADGEDSQLVTIDVVGDLEIEDDQTFRLGIANPTGRGTVVGSATADGIILNDDDVDLGDLPAPFPTRLDDNGPAHLAVGPLLGQARDAELDGQPSDLADGDNNAGTPDDEDGVRFSSLVFPGQLAAEVTVDVTGDGKLDAWIDFDGDRSFDGALEQVFVSQDVQTGLNILTFAVPPQAQQGQTFARFRLSTSGGLAPTGGAPDGEVEDYVLTIGEAFGGGVFGDSGQSLGDHSSLGVALGDLDGDGDLDAFVTNSYGTGNRIWTNNRGIFTDSNQLLGNHDSYSVALGDLDGDGDLDAFVANSNQQANRVWLNDAGTFTDSGQTLGSGTSFDVSLGDFDRDGDLDALVANSYEANRIWWNESGIFTDSGQGLGGHDSLAISLGDLDGDGDLDAFVANYDQGNRVWLNDGGTFTDSGQSLGDHRSWDAALGDLDGDGDLDAFVANADDGDRIWLNDAGTFSDSGQVLGDHFSFGVALGDIDGDGDLDAFVASGDTGSVLVPASGNRVLINDGGLFVDSGQALGSSATFDVALGDLDGDGDLDAFAANYYPTVPNRIWLDLEDRTLLSITPTDADKPELDSSTNPFTFEVTRAGDISAPATIDYSVTGSGVHPANADDFGGALPSGSVAFVANERSRTITIDVTGDTLREFDEQFTVTVANAGDADVINTSADGTIGNDDGSPALLVTSFVATNTGFVVEFNEDFDPSTLNLYDTQTGGNGPADVTIVGDATGPVTGSLAVAAGVATFVKTGDPLLADSYTVTLRSAENGFKNSAGVLLDGDADGLVGDDYVTSFTVDPAPANAVTVSIPDFVRGPGQAINVPADSTMGIPLSLSAAAGVRSVNLQIAYDPALLSVTAATVAEGVPAGAAVILNNTTPGLAILTFFSPADLPAAGGVFVNLEAAVPAADADAIYRAKEVLDLHEIIVSDSAATAFPVIDDDAIHVVTFFGDVSGNGRINANDAARVGRVAALLDSGFTDSLLADPFVVGDVSGNGRLNAADASRIARFAALIPVAEIPPIPPGVFVRPAGGPDPQLSIPQTLVAAPNGIVSAPVVLDSIENLQAPHRLVEADLVVLFDANILEATSVEPGEFLANRDGWALTTNIDNEIGRIVIVANTTTHPVAGVFTEVLVNLNFAVRPGAPAGATPINLAGRSASIFTALVDESDGTLELAGPLTDSADDPVDGLLTIVRPAGGLTRDEDLLAGLLDLPTSLPMWHDEEASVEAVVSAFGQHVSGDTRRAIDAAIEELTSAAREIWDEDDELLSALPSKIEELLGLDLSS